MKTITTDVAIIGGGPGGSSTGSLLKKYRPSLDVCIFEKEKFPREHVGESLLPIVCQVLHEMGCWEDVERANFPIKIGATYRWGQSVDLWDFEFIPTSEYIDSPRPGKYEGQRQRTAWQVERSVFDEILLANAKDRGCRVHEESGVKEVRRQGDRVTGLVLEDGTEVTAKYYVDASGSAAILRKAMGVRVDEPTALKNVAFWDYWENTEWAVHIGAGGTRIFVMSLPYGWIWFIPMGPTRTSIGLVVPARHYKEMGLSPEELYLKALREEPKIGDLTRNATRQGRVRGTRDWSFVSERLVGENWFLVGECAGFADPILSAGVTLTVTGGRELAYTIAALEKGKEDAHWLKNTYEEAQKKRINQHIRFADFWYSANGIFTDLKAFTSEIARDAGLELNANDAFQWIGTGGFTNDSGQVAGVAEFSVLLIKQLAQRFTESKADWQLGKFNVFRLKLDGADFVYRPFYHDGKVERVPAYTRDGHTWPYHGLYAIVLEALQRESSYEGIIRLVSNYAVNTGLNPVETRGQTVEFLEALLLEGWIEGRLDPEKKRFTGTVEDEGFLIHTNRDIPMDQPPALNPSSPFNPTPDASRK